MMRQELPPEDAARPQAEDDALELVQQLTDLELNRLIGRLTILAPDEVIAGARAIIRSRP